MCVFASFDKHRERRKRNREKKQRFTILIITKDKIDLKFGGLQNFFSNYT